MPKYIAHVRLADGMVDHVDCDIVHIDEHGYLRLEQRLDGRPVALSCYAPDAWLSYQSQTPPEDEPDRDGCAEAAMPVADNPAWPFQPGDVFHIVDERQLAAAVDKGVARYLGQAWAAGPVVTRH
jgi:hypothetical protein